MRSYGENVLWKLVYFCTYLDRDAKLQGGNSISSEKLELSAHISLSRPKPKKISALGKTLKLFRSYFQKKIKDLTDSDFNDFIDILTDGFPELSELDTDIIIEWLEEVKGQLNESNECTNRSDVKEISLNLGNNIMLKTLKYVYKKFE